MAERGARAKSLALTGISNLLTTHDRDKDVVEHPQWFSFALRANMGSFSMGGTFTPKNTTPCMQALSVENVMGCWDGITVKGATERAVLEGPTEAGGKRSKENIMIVLSSTGLIRNQTLIKRLFIMGTAQTPSKKKSIKVKKSNGEVKYRHDGQFSQVFHS